MYRTIVFAIIATLTALPACAQDGPPLSPEELKDQVGGLRTPDGLEFSFGAVVNTYIDGKLALKSQLTWTDAGALTTTDGGAVAGADAAGIHIDGAVPGTYVAGENGGTVVLHDLGDGRIGNIVLNTADNRNIRQDTVVNLAIPDLQQFQKDVAGQQLSASLQDSVSRAIGASAR